MSMSGINVKKRGNLANTGFESRISAATADSRKERMKTTDQFSISYISISSKLGLRTDDKLMTKSDRAVIPRQKWKIFLLSEYVLKKKYNAYKEINNSNMRLVVVMCDTLVRTLLY